MIDMALAHSDDIQRYNNEIQCERGDLTYDCEFEPTYDLDGAEDPPLTGTHDETRYLYLPTDDMNFVNGKWQSPKVD